MSRAIAVVFGVLVAATFAAFFVAARLKHTPSIVQSFSHTPLFSPNHDGRKDAAHVTFKLKKADHVTVQILDRDGDVVRTLMDDRRLGRYEPIKPSLVWDGREDDGRVAPDGLYRVKVILRDQGRAVIHPRSVIKDTTPPRPRVIGIGPDKKHYGPELLPEPGGSPAQIHFAPAQLESRILIFRTAPGKVKQVLQRTLKSGDREFDWDGTNEAGRPVSPGVYLAVPEWRDRAGNIGTSVPIKDGLPILTHGKLPGHGGMMVRYLGARPPTTSVKARDRVQIGVDARGKHYNWDIRKVGEPRPRKRSSQAKTKPIVTFGAPGGASGVYLFEVRTRDHATRVPIAVQARQPVAGTPDEPHGVLVLLPFITWQGDNPVDDDGDGAPNTLDFNVPAKPFRIMAGSGLPLGFTDKEAPLLQWLGRNGKRYDINTDMGLLVGRGPQLAGHHGVLIAGDSRWLPDAVRAKLRAFVRGGGTLVSIGTDSLRRTVKLDHKQRLADPSPERATDLVGERIAPLTTKTVNLQVFQQDPKIDLFKGSEGIFNDIPAWEETVKLGPEAELLTTAVTDPPQAKRVIVAARFGKGLVIRPGFPAFAPRLVQSTPDPAVSALMARMWTLLSH